MQGSKVPLKVGGESKLICCKAELVRVTSQISVGIALPYLMFTGGTNCLIRNNLWAGGPPIEALIDSRTLKKRCALAARAEIQ